jgi:CMP-N,N'-diacetyllegionaminic acid synthase
MGQTVAIIPARRGSKGIPGKNMRLLLGKPLVEWSIEQALNVRAVDHVLVSSDWPDILDLADKLGAYGLERPYNLATDITSTESVIDHILGNLDCDIETVMLLQPTSPNRTSGDIDNALQLYRQGDYDSLFSAVRFDRFLWWQRGPEADHHIDPLNYTLRKQRPRRQDIEYPQWLENGSIYIFDAKSYLKTSPRNRLFGRIGVYEMGAWSQFELDAEEDWAIMEYVMQRELIHVWPH